MEFSGEKRKSFLSAKWVVATFDDIDPLPTNCCAAWFCSGSSQFGKENIAVFFYACNFDCLFCQNASHKNLGVAKTLNINDFVSSVKTNEDAYCVCYFGGSPEPQLPFAIRASETILEDKEVENIASFIAGINPKISYSLLVFHPDFYMGDMPITPREQVQRCYDAARRHLKNVNIGNKQLLL